MAIRPISFKNNTDHFTTSQGHYYRLCLYLGLNQGMQARDEEMRQNIYYYCDNHC